MYRFEEEYTNNAVGLRLNDMVAIKPNILDLPRHSNKLYRIISITANEHMPHDIEDIDIIIEYPEYGWNEVNNHLSVEQVTLKDLPRNTRGWHVSYCDIMKMKRWD